MASITNILDLTRGRTTDTDLLLLFCCCPAGLVPWLWRPQLDTWQNRNHGFAEEKQWLRFCHVCSADGSTHTESNKLYRKVKHRYRPNLPPRQRPTAKARHDQAALAASAEVRGATHRARPRSHSHSGIDEKRPTEKFVYD